MRRTQLDTSILKTENSVSNPSGIPFPDGLETELSVSNFDFSCSVGTLRRDGKQFIDKRRRKKREKERKKRKKGRKENKKKERKEKGRRKLLPPLFQIWVDQELILHTSRGEGSFLFGYFLVWGHGNGIWLSLLCDCLNE